MFVEKIKLIWVRYRIIGVFVKVALLGAMAFLLCSIGSSHYDKVSDLTKGILGTIIGAIVGGCFTLYGSIIINRNIQRSTNAIRKKNTIYKPLYDELMEIHSKILVNDPYPQYIAFKRGPQTERAHPQYTVWGRIKTDSRYLEVPIKLKRTMESLYISIDNYRNKRSIAESSLELIYKEELSKLSIDSSNTLSNIGLTLLNETLSGTKSNNSFIVRNIKSDEEREKVTLIWNSLQERIANDVAYKQLLESRSLWNAREEETLEYLGLLISYISVKYEG